MRPVRSRTRGFTLMEILVVTFIIATLVALLFPAIQTMQARVNEQVCRNNLRVIGQTLQSYLTQFSNFLPVHGERSDGISWHPIFPGYQQDWDWAPRPQPFNPAAQGWYQAAGFSWQQILDKLLQADATYVEGGLTSSIYRSSKYSIDKGLSGFREMINRRGVHGVFTCPVSGYGRGIYMGSYTVFHRRLLPNQTVPHVGSLCVERIIEAAGDGQFGKIPVCADGSLGNSDNSWVTRFNQPQKTLDKQGNPTTFNTIHTTVIGSFLHVPQPGETDAGKEFIDIDFRHRGKAWVLYLGWNIAPWERPLEGPAQKADPYSRFNFYKNTWDSMFFRGVNATP